MTETFLVWYYKLQLIMLTSLRSIITFRRNPRVFLQIQEIAVAENQLESGQEVGERLHDTPRELPERKVEEEGKLEYE
uniref:Uncharacterized protein n=1 Tax=Triticum urartu TaxID=4572 RepID=A0A8R7V4A2_TRIUA